MDKVLVVDNDPDILKKAEDGFKDLHHFELLTAVSVQSAIAILQKERISVLATAVRLPETDGLELMAYMTRKLPSIPCIAMLDSGDPKPWFSKRDGHAGVLYYLRKPFAFSDLASTIFVGLNLRDEGLTRKGMILGNFLPLIRITRKTCRLEIRCNAEKTGLLYFSDGQLLDARANDRTGEAAVKEMAEWNGFQMTISDLPADRKQNNRIARDMMGLIDATWEKEPGTATPKHLKTKKADRQSDRPQPPAPRQDPPTTEPPPSGRNKLETALLRHAGILRTVKGYRGLAVLSTDGKLLAADPPEKSAELETLSTAAGLIHTDCSRHLNLRGLGPCNGFMFQTPDGFVIMRTTDLYSGGNFRFIARMSEEGNGFFLQVQLKTIIPKILADISN